MKLASSSAGPGAATGDSTLRPLTGLLATELSQIKVDGDPALLLYAVSKGRVRVEDAVCHSQNVALGR
jgi:hypothetical protein